MMTNDEIRRLNLLAAAKRAGNAAKLAGLINTAPAYLSQIKTRTPDSKNGTPKTMGDDIARRIEVAISEPSGWMDTPHPEEWGGATTSNAGPTIVNIPARPPVAEIQKSEDEVMAGLMGIALVYSELSPESRKHLADRARELLEQDERNYRNGHDRRETTKEMDDGVLRKHGLG